MAGFPGFPPETAAFLRGIAGNNTKEWFTANRALYDVGYVDAGRAFVEAVGPELGNISPTVQFEPKIGASLMRVNRDIRFSRDKRPYKVHLDLFSGTVSARGGRIRGSSSGSPASRSGSAAACTTSRATC